MMEAFLLDVFFCLSFTNNWLRYFCLFQINNTEKIFDVLLILMCERDQIGSSSNNGIDQYRLIQLRFKDTNQFGTDPNTGICIFFSFGYQNEDHKITINFWSRFFNYRIIDVTIICDLIQMNHLNRSEGRTGQKKSRFFYLINY